jgi:hypothetical protein
MAGIVPIMPFLRPMAPPRPSTIRQFLQFSNTARRCYAQQTETRVSQRGTNASELDQSGPSQGMLSREARRLGKYNPLTFNARSQSGSIPHSPSQLSASLFRLRPATENLESLSAIQ